MRPRTAAAALVLVACAIGAPLLGVAAAEASRPTIEPAAPIDRTDAIHVPPMPAPPSARADVSAQFSPLPLVERGLAATPRPFFADYMTAPTLDGAARARALELAVREL